MPDLPDASAAYLESIRQELPLYDQLQDQLIQATYGVAVRRILDLGAGTGETSRRCLEAYPDADLVAVDPSEPLLRIAAQVLGSGPQLRLGFLDEPLPKGPFDLVVSALSVNSLAPNERSHLFSRIRRVLSPRGRFVLADLVAPESAAAAAPTAGQAERMDTLLGRLRASGLRPEVTWTDTDLAVIASSVA